jgi:hypothetical protein
VINKKFEDYFGSRVEFYKAVEFIFIHLNMSKMITFYMVTLSDTNSFNIINAWNTNKCLSCDFVKLSVIVSGEMPLNQEKKITIKAFNKLKSTVYKLDRDNVGQYLIFDNIEPIKTINLDEFLWKKWYEEEHIKCFSCVFVAYTLYQFWLIVHKVGFFNGNPIWY